MADIICRNIRGLIYSRNEILGENITIEKEIEAIKSELFTMSTSIEDISHETCKFRQEIKQLDEQKSNYEEEARRKEEIFNQKSCQMKNLCKENECLTTRSKQLKKETCDTKKKLAAFENFLYEMKKNAEQIDLTAETMLYQNKESKDEVSRLNSRVSQIKRYHRELSEDLESICICLDEVFQHLTHAESARDQLECKETDIRRQVLELQTKLCNIQSKLQGEQAYNEKLQENIAQGKSVLEDLQNSLENYEREMEKIERRKEHHLKEILSVINEVKDDIKVQKSCFRKLTSREKPVRVSWSSSGEYINKPVEPKRNRSGMISELRSYCNPQKLLDLIKKNPYELVKCQKPELDEFRTETMMNLGRSSKMRFRDEMNTKNIRENEQCSKQDYGRGNSTYRPEREFRNRPNSMMASVRSHSNMSRESRDIDTDTGRPKTIDITIRNTKQTIKKKKSEGCKVSRLNKNSCKNTVGQDDQKKQMTVDAMIRELLGSDIMDSNECSNDIKDSNECKNDTMNNMKRMKHAARVPTCNNMRNKK